MDAEIYSFEHKIEATHWWFVGRRHLFEKVIKKICLPKDAHILDIGSGTGANLRLLRDLEFKNACGLDSSPMAIKFCLEKNLPLVHHGDACRLPFDDSRFDLVLATDVIEHIAEDQKAIHEITRVLRPGGYALFTVPAFQFLWGRHDEAAMHKRRYRKQDLIKKLQWEGLKIRRSYYFNYILFLPIYIARKFIKYFNIQIRNENEINNSFLNAVLCSLFKFDVITARLLSPPFGVSILILAQKEDQ